MEILSPAGSLESLKAAVTSGADAIYIGYGDFNARRNAKNFTKEEFIEGIAFAKEYGVHIYVTMNILLTDRELVPAKEFIEFLATLDIDGVIVQDLGVLHLLKNVCPTMPIHASTQLTIHNLDGAIKAKELGFSRVVVSRELSFDDIKYICQNSGIEIEVFAHGALCMSYSGQCYFSAVIGSRSGNRGLCAQPCRLPYSYNNDKNKNYPLSLKDLSLIHYIKELKEIGVACVKIEGRMKKAEYTGIVTSIYSRVSKENRKPTQEEQDVLYNVFSRQGFTDGYFTGKIDDKMFGVKSEEKIDKNFKIPVVEAKKEASTPVSFEFFAKKNKLIKLVAKSLGSTAEAFGEISDIAINKPTDSEQIIKSLSKVGGTNFYVDNIDIDLDDGLRVPASSINALRREVLEKIYVPKEEFKPRETFDYKFEKSVRYSKISPKYTVEVTKISQISDSMMTCKPHALYIPIFEICQNIQKVSDLIKDGFNIVAKLPRIALDSEMPKVYEMLEKVRKIGITKLLVSNIGFIYQDFEIYGDIGLNAYNSITLDILKQLGVSRQTMSFELKVAQMRDIIKKTPTEIIAYGHLPLMIFENDVMEYNQGKNQPQDKKSYLVDRKGEKFQLIAEFGDKNSLYNSKPLYILDKIEDFTALGVEYFRICFVDETKNQADLIYKSHIENKPFECDFTRGLYYRGVN